MTKTKTMWDTVEGTMSAAIDMVLMRATRPLSRDEIQAEVRRLGFKTRTDPSPHLSTLKKRKYVTNEAGLWFKTPLGASRSHP